MKYLLCVLVVVGICGQADAQLCENGVCRPQFATPVRSAVATVVKAQPVRSAVQGVVDSIRESAPKIAGCPCGESCPCLQMQFAPMTVVTSHVASSETVVFESVVSDGFWVMDHKRSGLFARLRDRLQAWRCR